jgi:hypothetical protein
MYNRYLGGSESYWMCGFTVIGSGSFFIVQIVLAQT